MSKTILITGCSSGFGKLAVPMLLQRGHTVIAGLRGGEARARDTFPDAPKDRLLAFDLHMENPDSFSAGKKLIDDRFGGKLDVLINNAGYGLMGALEDMTDAQIRHQFEVNVFGPLALTKLLLPALRAARGKIINVGSIVGVNTLPLYGAYCASKHAVEAISEGFYYDLRRFGVQVAVVQPGGFGTEFGTRSRKFGRDPQVPEELYGPRNKKMGEAFEMVSARLGNPARVARLLVKLSDKSRLGLRYVIGYDAHLMNFYARILPDSWRIRLQYAFFWLGVFRD
ncbi:MAG: SDR family oxidoreductase [Bdellovibrionota bacterium]